jgi:hypothetical protein
MSNRTRSKVPHTDQNVGDRTRSKLKAICNSTNKGVFFTFYDSIKIKRQENFKNIDLQLGFTECRVYHNALLESNSQSKIDCLRTLFTLDTTEDDKDRYWECIKVLKHCKEKGVDCNISYNCLVVWNFVNQSQS